MAKTKTSYVCQECGYDSPAFLGKCPECGSWQSFKEIRIAPTIERGSGGLSPLASVDVTPRKLSDVEYSHKQRIATGFTEMDMVLGGGLVLGAVSLLAGDPGIGKSTLLLQLCLTLAEHGRKVLYISGEESAEQIKMRASRLIAEGQKNDTKNSKNSHSDNLFLLAISDIDSAIAQVASMKPDLIVVDSVQTMESQNVAGLSGSVAQVRYTALHCIRAAKTMNIPLILVGHVTKEGTVAGPMVLSHMVDTVLFLEGERFTTTRMLRSLKNRFGPVDEVGVFRMEEGGMQEVTNPEQLFLNKDNAKTPGSVLVATLEGSRAFLVELQALVVSSRLPMPRRVVSGIDARRVELLLAVLQKHCRLPLDTTDVFVNVAGGIKLADPAIDLGICLAVFSSYRNMPLDKAVGIAEVGLLGELRLVPALEKRMREAQQLGFSQIITAKTHKSLVDVLGRMTDEPKQNRKAAQ
jgi:DNA repair protein RadA/Sms